MSKRMRWHYEQAEAGHQCGIDCWFRYGYDDDEDVEDALARLAQARTDEEVSAIEASLLAETDNEIHPGDPEEQPEQ
jgi:hypothetical protein